MSRAVYGKRFCAYMCLGGEFMSIGFHGQSTALYMVEVRDNLLSGMGVLHASHSDWRKQ